MIFIKYINKSENSRPGIYAINNLVNGKKYIGQSTNLYHRQCGHMTNLNNNMHPNQHLQNAWNKYGKEQFEFIIIEYCSIEKLNEKEKYWIDYYQSNIMGYNIRIDATSNRGLKWSDEHRKKMMKIINNPNGWYKNHSIPESTLKKAHEASKNKIWTQEERERFSKINKGKTVADTSNMKKAQTGENNNGAKLTEKEVEEIIYLLSCKYTVRTIAKAYEVCESTISAIKHCRSWNNISRINPINDFEIQCRAKKRFKI